MGDNASRTRPRARHQWGSHSRGPAGCRDRGAQAGPGTRVRLQSSSEILTPCRDAGYCPRGAHGREAGHSPARVFCFLLRGPDALLGNARAPGPPVGHQSPPRPQRPTCEGALPPTPPPNLLPAPRRSSKPSPSTHQRAGAAPLPAPNTRSWGSRQTRPHPP